MARSKSPSAQEAIRRRIVALAHRLKRARDFARWKLVKVKAGEWRGDDGQAAGEVV